MVRVVEVRVRRALTPSGIYSVDYSLNPYVGCQHACRYCYVPYTYPFTSPLEWGGLVKVKANLPRLLPRELKRAGPCRVLMSSVTDPYQPIEAQLSLARACLEALRGLDVELVVLTKSSLVRRDLDVMKRLRSCEVGVTVTTLRAHRLLEPASSSPLERLKAVEEASRNGLDTFLFLGPMIPRLIEAELDQILNLAVKAGCSRVVVDKLRLRPGMEAPLVEALSPLMDPSLAMKEAKRPSYYEGLKPKIAALAEDRGLEVEFCY